MNAECIGSVFWFLFGTTGAAGGSVILLEKAPEGHEGGSTRVAAQG
jgi:hypothetical protein